ncbi:hypothetical protein K439DRAFT_1510961 [Ramaria rubella]|nr:hypothetical protein K439DRAFT_1510961 [Ramaria rubella]
MAPALRKYPEDSMEAYINASPLSVEVTRDAGRILKYWVQAIASQLCQITWHSGLLAQLKTSTLLTVMGLDQMPEYRMSWKSEIQRLIYMGVGFNLWVVPSWISSALVFWI